MKSLKIGSLIFFILASIIQCGTDDNFSNSVQYIPDQSQPKKNLETASLYDDSAGELTVSPDFYESLDNSSKKKWLYYTAGGVSGAVAIWCIATFSKYKNCFTQVGDLIKRKKVTPNPGSGTVKQKHIYNLNPTSWDELSDIELVRDGKEPFRHLTMKQLADAIGEPTFDLKNGDQIAQLKNNHPEEYDALLKAQDMLNNYKNKAKYAIESFHEFDVNQFPDISKKDFRKTYRNFLIELHVKSSYKERFAGKLDPLKHRYNERTDALIYTQELLNRYMPGEEVVRGSLKIDGIPKELRPRNSKGRPKKHWYPPRHMLDPYFEAGSDVMYEILNGLHTGDKSPKEVQKLIGQYYFIMIHARPFEQINNSLFMNQVNYLLKRTGHDGIAQGYIDHAVTRLNQKQFNIIWKEIVKAGLNGIQKPKNPISMDFN